MLLLVLAACNKQPPQLNQDIAVEENIAAGQLPPNAEFETLPQDESSTTPSNQLQNGFDNADGNDLGNGH